MNLLISDSLPVNNTISFSSNWNLSLNSVIVSFPRIIDVIVRSYLLKS